MPKFLKLEFYAHGIEIHNETVEVHAIRYRMQLIDWENKKMFSSLGIAYDEKLQGDVKEILKPFNEELAKNNLYVDLDIEPSQYADAVPACAYIKLTYSKEDHHTKEAAEKVFRELSGKINKGDDIWLKTQKYSEAHSLFSNTNRKRNLKLISALYHDANNESKPIPAP